jgi:hypothetical protein
MDDQSARILSVINKTYPLKLFTDEQRERIATNAVVDEIAEGTAIYREHEEAITLNLILSGEVHLFWLVDEEDEEAGEISLGNLEPGDVFGLEALEEESTYAENAVALSQLRIVRFSLEFLDPYFEENALPYHVLMLMLSSLRLFHKIDLPWRNPEESVIYMARRNSVFLVYRLILPLIVFIIGITILLLLIILNPAGMTLVGFVAGFVALIGGLWSIWNYVDWTNDYAILTNQRAVFQERIVLLYDSRLETPLEAILATSLDSSQIGRILGYGDVVMKTYTGTLIFPDIAQWDTVRALVDDRRMRARELNLQQEKQTIQTMVRQRLRMTPPTPGVQQIVQQEERHISFGERLANFFRMRSEKNGVITYRTHWSIMVRKVFMPALVMFGIVVLAVLRLLGTFNFLSSLAFWPLWFILVLVDGFWLWYRFEDWINDQYIVSDEQIVDVYKKPLGQEEKRVAPLKSIQSVEFERLGFIGLVLNYGTVYIRIGDARFSFDNVYNPSEVQRDLFRRIAAQADRDRRNEADAERQRILDVLEAYHEVTRNSPPSPNP